MIRTAVYRTGAIGVEIGTATIKVAQVEDRAEGLVLVRAAIAPRQTAPTSSGPAGSVEAELRRALTTCQGMKGNRARSVLSFSSCRYASDLVTGELTAQEAAQRAAEIAARIPFPTADRHYDFWTTGSQLSTIVHVLVTDRLETERAAVDHRRAGLACEAIEGLPQALAQALQLGAHDAPQPTAVLNWGYSAATFCVVDRGTPLFVRQLPHTEYLHAEQSVCRHLGLTAREACRLMVQIGIPDAGADEAGRPEGQLLLQALEEPLARLTGQLRRTWAFLRTYHEELVPHALTLTGGGATLSGLPAQLERQLDVPVRVWDFPSRVPGVPTCLLAPAISLSARRWVAS